MLPQTAFAGVGVADVQPSADDTDAVMLEDMLGTTLVPDGPKVMVELGAPDRELDTEVMEEEEPEAETELEAETESESETELGLVIDGPDTVPRLNETEGVMELLGAPDTELDTETLLDEEDLLLEVEGMVTTVELEV